MLLQNLQAEFKEQLILEEKNSEGIHPPENILIYQNNILSTLTNVLLDTYPLICQLIGEPFFRVTIKEYIKRYPSRSPNLHDYGEYLSDFIATYPPLKDLIYLAEVARFEWICHILYFAADHVGFDIQTFKQFSEKEYEHLQFTLHPASRIVKFHFPILRIIDLCKKEMDEEIDIHSGGVNLLMFRRHLDISLIPLSTSEFTFLSQLDQGHTLSEALTQTLHIDPHFDLKANLQKWIQDHIIVDCRLLES